MLKGSFGGQCSKTKRKKASAVLWETLESASGSMRTGPGAPGRPGLHVTTAARPERRWGPRNERE